MCPILLSYSQKMHRSLGQLLSWLPQYYCAERGSHRGEVRNRSCELKTRSDVLLAAARPILRNTKPALVIVCLRRPLTSQIGTSKSFVSIMPPRIAPDAGPGRGGRDRGRGRGGERGRGRGGERGGGRGGERGGWRGGERGGGRGGDRGGGRGFRGEGRGRGDRGGGHGRGNRGAPGGERGRGRSRGAGAGAPAGSPPPLPAVHVEAVGVKRPGYGNRGDWISVVSNHVEVRLDQDQGYIYHYDGMYLSSFRKDVTYG